MSIAYTIAGRGETDPILFKVASELGLRGFRTCGTVQINSDQPANGPCDMDVKILPHGPVIRISQSLGAGSRGCRLDPQRLEEAVELVRSRLMLGADVLIINKFGKHEAGGRGFRNVIAEALMKEIPVLLGLNALNQAAFFEFAGEFATQLPPEIPSLMNWVEGNVRQHQKAS